jgi:SAM-dependent methyltransferase
VTVDHYAGAERRWATGARFVYGPIAHHIVAASPHPFAGRVVLDAGAGTGLVSEVLAKEGARGIAMDLSLDMLAWNRANRPPATVADLCALPLADEAVDDSVAAFVLNHLIEPAAGFAELIRIRVTRPGGAVLAGVFANSSRSEARDRVDDTAVEAGWQAPDWYRVLKAKAAPVLGTAGDMAAVAHAVGLHDVTVDERAVDVGMTEPEELVEYRFGQAQFTGWLDHIGAEHAAQVKQRAADSARPIMRPYRPVVVLLSSRRSSP